MPRAKAVREIEENMGTQFSPRVAETFLKALRDGKLPTESRDSRSSDSETAEEAGEAAGNGSGKKT